MNAVLEFNDLYERLILKRNYLEWRLRFRLPWEEQIQLQLECEEINNALVYLFQTRKKDDLIKN